MRSANPAILIVLVLLMAATPPLRAEIVVLDDAGRAVHLLSPARRIISLAPHATELLFASGAGTHVIGVSAFSDYPAAARRLPRVSGGPRLDLERILALKPDLIVGWQSGNTGTDLDRLATLGIPVFIAEPKRLEAVPDTLLRLGRLSGSEPTARITASHYRRTLDGLRAKYRDRRPVRVFFEIAAQPLMTLSRRHMANDVLALCGGQNVFSASSLMAPAVSVEAVLLQDPDVILFSDELGTIEGVRGWWKQHAKLRAVRTGQVYSVPADLVLRQSPRILLGVQHVCESLDAARAVPENQPPTSD